MTDHQARTQSSEVTDILDSCLKSAIESIGSGILAVDLDGSVVLFNRAAETITGYGREEIIGCAYDRLPFVLQASGRGELFRLLKKRGEAEAVERSLSARDGRKIPVESRVHPITNGNGKLIGALEIFNDLSAINELREEVSKSRTLSALGEMSANVAHEIRNPLGSIGGFATLLERDLADDDPRRNLVKKIIEGVASLDKIVTNLLIYTRPLKADLRWTDLVEYVNEVLAFLEVEIESQTLPITIRRLFPEKSIAARIDPSLMQQVLLNIFRNAVHAMRSGGGCLTIGISRSESAPVRESLPECQTEDVVELVIEDEGVGMTEEVQKKIFNPFFTTREDGTGLGLAISKKMIQEQKGAILVSSQIDVGTKIRILLPYFQKGKGE